MSVRRSRNAAFTAVGCVLTLVVILAAGEGVARFAGYRPWASGDGGTALYKPDPVLGWVHKAGDYRIRAGWSDGRDIVVTFLDDGGRKTSNSLAAKSRGDFIIVGDSFSEGWALSDRETFPWKLQERFPSHRVLNYGTGAYGTYQSLLMLERALRLSVGPKAVIYGFFHHHPERNVAEAGWLEGLDRYSGQNRTGLPYVTLDKSGNPIRHDPVYYPRFPFRRFFALVTLLEKAAARIASTQRTAQSEAVTRALLLKMDELSRAKGAEFLFVPLSAPVEMKRDYLGFVAEHGIAHVDCSIYPVPNELTIRGEGHPNGLANTRWAECISKALKKMSPSEE
jgi:hypothetical protein